MTSDLIHAARSALTSPVIGSRTPAEFAEEFSRDAKVAGFSDEQCDLACVLMLAGIEAASVGDYVPPSYDDFRESNLKLKTAMQELLDANNEVAQSLASRDYTWQTSARKRLLFARINAGELLA